MTLEDTVELARSLADGSRRSEAAVKS